MSQNTTNDALAIHGALVAFCDARIKDGLFTAEELRKAAGDAGAISVEAVGLLLAHRISMTDHSPVACNLGYAVERMRKSLPSLFHPTQPETPEQPAENITTVGEPEPAQPVKWKAGDGPIPGVGKYRTRSDDDLDEYLGPLDAAQTIDSTPTNSSPIAAEPATATRAEKYRELAALVESWSQADGEFDDRVAAQMERYLSELRGEPATAEAPKRTTLGELPNGKKFRFASERNKDKVYHKIGDGLNGSYGVWVQEAHPPVKAHLFDVECAVEIVEGGAQ